MELEVRGDGSGGGRQVIKTVCSDKILHETPEVYLLAELELVFNFAVTLSYLFSAYSLCSLIVVVCCWQLKLLNLTHMFPRVLTCLL